MVLGYYNEHTGNPKDGNYQCSVCQGHVAVGFRHRHILIEELEKDRARLDFLDVYGYEFLRWARKNLIFSSIHQKFRPALDYFMDIKKDE